MKRCRKQREKFAELEASPTTSEMETIPMPRWPIFAVLGCLYVALSMWIVGKQGQAYRDGLREHESCRRPNRQTVATPRGIAKRGPAGRSAGN